MFRAHELAATIPHRIKELRTQRGLDPEALGARAGIASGRLADIEAGAGLPSLEDLQRLAAALGVQLQDLLAPRG